MTYHAIIIGGIYKDRLGRPLGPYRLRTAAKKRNYAIKVVDYANVLSEKQVIDILDKLVTPETLVVGVSASWFNPGLPGNVWINDNFFKTIKARYPQIKIVIGGTKISAFDVLHRNSDWFLNGFSDISFMELLDHLSGKKVNLKYIRDKHGVRIVSSDIHYIVPDVNDLETEYEKEDNFLSHQPLTLEVSRGCIFKCAFCTHPFLGKKNFDYIRQPENLAREMARNYELFGTTRYFISDDTFNDSIEKLDRVKRAIEIAKLPNFEFIGYIKPELLVTKPEMIPMLIDMGLKGAQCGIESLNMYARKVVGKGMEVEKIFDGIEKLTAGGVRVHGSHILGLPGDTYEDFDKWQEFYIKNKNSLLGAWSYNTLGIIRNTLGEAYSVIEKEPEKFGYVVKEIPRSQFMDWTHESGTTKKNCDEISNRLTDESKIHHMVAGWQVGAAWFHNLPQEKIDNTIIRQTGLDQLAAESSNKRALENYNKIVKGTL